MAFLFDLDGVFYEGDEAICGAAEVAVWVNQNRIPHLFITNTSSRPRNALVQKLAGFGIQTDTSHIITPAVATLGWLKQQPGDQRIALFVAPSTRDEFSSLPIWHEDDEQVTALVVGDLGEGWTFQVLNQAFRLLMRQPQPQLIALGMTRYWQAEDGLRLDVAPFIVALEHAADTQAVVMGKPAKPFYQAALTILGESAAKTIMVGDDIHADVAGAQNAGIPGILVKTGKFRSADLSRDIQPLAVLESIRDLPGWWHRNQHSQSS